MSAGDANRMVIGLKVKVTCASNDHFTPPTVIRHILVHLTEFLLLVVGTLTTEKRSNQYVLHAFGPRPRRGLPPSSFIRLSQ
jgi:hypothetical protein